MMETTSDTAAVVPITAGPGVRVGAGGGLARLPDGGGARPSSAGRVLLPDGWCDDERPQESHEFGTGQRDELGCSGRAGPGRGSSGECEDGGGDQGEQGPAHPGVPGGHLTFVQAGECLAELEGLLDRYLWQITSTSWERVMSPGVQKRKKESSPVYRCRQATRMLVPFS